MTAIEVGVVVAHDLVLSEPEAVDDPTDRLHMPTHMQMITVVHGSDAAWRSDRRRAWPIRLGRRIRRLFA